jgi:DNA-directed RNA polymerase specialized sigma24 family protein
LWRFAFIRCKDRDVADDAIQELSLYLMREDVQNGYDPTRPLLGLAFWKLRFICIDLLRALGRSRRQDPCGSAGTSPESIANDLPTPQVALIPLRDDIQSPEPTPDEEATRNEEVERFTACLNNLPSKRLFGKNTHEIRPLF